MKLKLTEIRSEGNVRQDLGDVSDLAASIKEQGLLHPLTVKKNGKGYILIDGHRRFAAAKIAGLTEVEADVKEIADEKIVSAQVATALHRKGLTPFEISHAVGVELKKRGFRLDHDGVIPAGLDEVAEEIARSTGSKINWVKSMARLVFLPPWAAKLLENDNLTVAQATYLLTLPPEALDKIDKDFYKLNNIRDRDGRFDSKRDTRGEKILTEDLEDFVEKAFGKSLVKAPFPLDEPVGDKAPCLTCAFNTTNTQDLFNTKGQGVCRMVECFKSKCSTVSSELRAKYAKQSGLPFIGYASWSASGWNQSKPSAPAEVKGMKVIEADKKLLAADIAACTGLAKDGKPGGKDAAKTYGFAILRGREGLDPKVVHVMLKAVKEKKRDNTRDFMPKLIQNVAREMRRELVIVPAAAIISKIKLDAHKTALFLHAASPDTGDYQDIGAGKMQGKTLNLKGLTWEQIGQAAMLAALMQGDDDAIALAKFSPNEKLSVVAVKLKGLTKQIEDKIEYESWGSPKIPPALVKACAEAVRGKPFEYTLTPSKTEEDGDDGQGEGDGD